MDFTAQEIALLALVGVIAGLLPSTIAERRGVRLAADIGAGVAGVFVAAWLVASWRDLVPFSLTTPAGKPPEKVSVDINIPNYDAGGAAARATAPAAQACGLPLARGDLRRARAVGAEQRPAGAVFHPAVVPGEHLPARRHQLGRRARHSAVHAGDGRAPAARQSVRPGAGDPGVGETFARPLPPLRQSRPGRRRL